MQPPINQLYKFGPFCLDVIERVLICDERVVPLSPKLFDTLLVLIENRGRILGKDELMQAIWPDTFVEESNLTHNISQIRFASAFCHSSIVRAVDSTGQKIDFMLSADSRRVRDNEHHQKRTD
jgi:DNA-binding winged helix-turn-helix (wHTH) protein